MWGSRIPAMMGVGCSNFSQRLLYRHFCTGMPLGVLAIHMPQLSPCMLTGSISQWFQVPGKSVAILDLVYEVRTTSLLELGAEKLRQKNRGRSVELDLHSLDIETHDEGIMGDIIVPENVEVPVGTILAYMYEDQRSYDVWHQQKRDHIQQLIREYNSHVARDYTDKDGQCQDPKILYGDGVELEPFLWQAYGHNRTPSCTGKGSGIQ